MASVTRVKNLRLGIKMAGRKLGPGADTNAAIGWALFRTGRPKIGKIERGNPLDLLREAAAQWVPDRDGPFTLYVYETEDAYRGTEGYKSGLSRMEHWLMVGQLAAQLASEGTAVRIVEVS